MTRYFAQNTPRAGLEHMMMSVPGFQKRGGGMMILSRFCYKPEDVDCRYCLHYRRRSCQVRTCPYIAERLKSGAIEYLDLILEYFGHIPHAGLHKRIQAVEHWSGPDQAVLHTVSVHLRSRFADRVWDDAPPGYRKAVTQVGTAWGLPIPDTQRWLDLIRQEEIAVTQAAEPEKVNHVMEEKDLPINASGLQTLDNIWGLFETAVKLNSADGRREMYALARELSECQNLTDWIIKSQTENEGAQVSMACTQN